ncbi:hypothetical protein FSP39_011243 [Pinctada imbricata]|uniref:non-specific serine/threonine protein kinase n=1 Tax=Pinctada imbricata TaxID=66713 RepID=A0AA88YEC8_PINIB|nr:hypothetical protein FSP39_011243 [Pinctada imbricata]
MDETLSPRKELKTPKSLNLLKEILQRKEDEPEKRFSIEVWDFGGQGCFYCTHQSFLSYRSVYLLVFDISKDLDDFVNDEDLDPSERKKSTVREFLSFWINSIKTYAGGVVRGCPKIIIVGTHLDKIEKSKRLQKVGEYLTAICDTYAEDIASGQLILDNKLVFGFNNYGIEILQNAIIKVAKGQPFWGEELPKAWIPFQHRISILCQEGKKIISCKEIKDFNLTLPVPLDLENIDLCLRFLHSVGSIIFYSQKALSAYVILEPKWLVTTLRSLITCESFCAQEEVRRGACKILQQMGLISMERIEAIWKLPEFSELIPVKNHMLAIMERLDLIAKPKIYQNGSIVTTDSFFIPAMAKNSPSPKWLTTIVSSSRVQMCSIDFSTSFLSPAVFYRLISSCICIWPVHQDKLYFGCCQLRLDPQHRLLILKRGDRICLVFEHRRTAVAINKNLVRGVMDVVVDILQDIINIYPGRKDSPFFTISGNFTEEDVLPTCSEGCTSSCIVGRNDILCISPSDLELMRFAKSWLGAKDNLVLIAVELGVDMRELEQIEHDHRDNLVLKTFYILERWSRRRGKSSSFKELLEASQCDVHTICKIMREDDARVHQTIPTSRLEEQCTDEMIDKISVLIGRDFIHFGLELGLHQEDIEEIRNSKDTRGLFDMNRRIMMVTRDHRPGGTSLSIRSLSCALLRIGHVKAFEYFEDQFITEHDDDLQDDW